MKTFSVEFAKKPIYRFTADSDLVKAGFGGSYGYIKWLRSGMDCLANLVHVVDFDCSNPDKTTMIVTFYAISEPVVVEDPE